jgi:hypothetical protein
VLFVGTYSDVPMRRTAQDLGHGRPQTDFYFAELSEPDSASWDADGDHQWGEDTDPIDFYAEINTGRIPWSGADRVSSICQKSVAYEQNDDPAFKKNMLLLGAYFWADTDNAELMEAKVNQPWMSDWTITRMYEQNADYWSSFSCDYPLLRSNVMSVWPNGTFAFVNWAGHGSPTSTHILGLGSPGFIYADDCASLNDNYPAIVFADACSNSDTDYPNIGKVMIDHGAVGFVGATKVAYGQPAWNSPYDGSSQSLDYFFTTYVTSHDYTQGAGLQRALLEMYTHDLWGNDRYETFEWCALWGNPNLSMGTPAPLAIIISGDLPEYVAPGIATTINVEIREGVEAYVPGSGLLYYRYDGGTYLTSPLVSLGGDLYEATLPPASCADAPEFYFSAAGDGGTTVTSPVDAPASVYAATVGTETVLFEDDFETDQGWSVYAGADTGDWELADPAEVNNDGTITQPGDDHSTVGTMCYVTGPLAGTSAGTHDVDGGPTRLTSPVFDWEGLDPIVSYWRWYHISTQWNDELLVEVSNDGGTNWVPVESITDRETWTQVEWRVSDYVTPTDQMQVRFTADDSPNDSLVEALIDDFSVISVVCDDVECPGDLDGDNDVDLADLSQLLSSYGMTSGAQEEDGDMDGDGDVDLADLSALLAVYGTTC